MNITQSILDLCLINVAKLIKKWNNEIDDILIIFSDHIYCQIFNYN